MSQLIDSKNEDTEKIISVEDFNSNNKKGQESKPAKKNRKTNEVVPVEEFTAGEDRELNESNIPKPVIWNYNKRTWESYSKNGISPPDNLDLQERNFLRKVKVNKKPIEREVTKIVRIRTRDYTSKKREYKDFLYWFENWFGVDWLGQKIPPVTDHVEGIYMEQEMEPVVKNMELVGYKRLVEYPVYYIPFSKEKVDEIIESSTKNVVSDIQFVVKGQTYRTGGYTYEQFVNSSFDECIEMQMTVGGPSIYEHNKKRQIQQQKDVQKQHKQYS